MALGTTRAQRHLVAVFLEGDVATEWLDTADARIQTLTARAAGMLVLRGRRGSIPRTSSGKPRRRLLWQALTEDTPSGWIPVRGDVPAEMVLATSPPSAADRT